MPRARKRLFEDDRFTVDFISGVDDGELSEPTKEEEEEAKKRFTVNIPQGTAGADGVLSALTRGVSRGLHEGFASVWEGIGRASAAPSRLLGLEPSGERLGWDYPAKRAEQLRAETPERRGGAAETIAELATRIPVEILPSAAYASVAGPVAGLALKGAAETYGSGASKTDTAIEAAKEAIIGAVLKNTEGLRLLPRASINAVTGGVMSGIEGGSPEDVALSAGIAGGLSALLGKAPPKKATARKSGGRKPPEQHNVPEDAPAISGESVEPPPVGKLPPQAAVAAERTILPGETVDEALSRLRAEEAARTKQKLPVPDERIEGKPPKRVINYYTEDIDEQLKVMAADAIDSAEAAIRDAQNKKTIKEIIESAESQFPEGSGVREYWRSHGRRMPAAVAAARQADVNARQFYREALDKLEAARASGANTDALEVEVAARAAEFHAALLTSVGMKSEAGRALRTARELVRVQSPAEIALAKLAKADKLTVEASQRLMMTPEDDIKTAVEVLREAYSPSAGEYLYEVWINQLLGIPTQIVNAASNLSMQLMKSASRVYAAGSDFLVSKVKGGQRTTTAGEVIADLTGYLSGIRKGAYAFVRSMRSGGFDESKLEYLPATRGALGEFIRLNGTLLRSADEFFKAIAATREARVLAYRDAVKKGASHIEALKSIDSKLEDLLEHKDILLAMRKAAKEAEIASLTGDPEKLVGIISRESLSAAAEQTFTSRSGGFVNALVALREADKSGLLKVLVPFIKTPTNIIKTALRMTPANFVRIAAKGGGWGREKLASELGLTVLGTQIGALVAYAAHRGIITGGGPADPELRKNKLQTGWQPRSFKIGDTYIPYGRLEPFATIAGMAADMVETAKVGGDVEDIAKKITAAISDNLTNKTFLQGLEATIMIDTDPQKAFPRLVRQLGGSVVPSTVAAVARAVDPVVRDVDALATTGGVPDVMAVRIPYKSKELPARRSATGEVAIRPGTAAERFLGIATSKELPGRELEREFDALGYVPTSQFKMLEYGKELGPIVGVDPDERFTLTREEREIKKNANWYAAQVLRRAIVSPEWAMLTNDEKKDIIESVYRQAHGLANKQIRARRASQYLGMQ